MRKFLVCLLLASAAVPAFAAPRDERDGEREPRPERAERAERRSDDNDQRTRASERQAPPAEAVERPARSFGANPDGNEGRRFDRRQQVEQVEPAEQAIAVERRRQGAGDTVRTLRRGDSGDTVRNWRSVERRRDDSPSVVEERNLDDGSQSIEERNVRRLGRSARGGPLIREVPTTGGITGREVRRLGGIQPVRGTQAPPPATAQSLAGRTDRHWRRDWRRDRRYDWSNWRRRHRSRFHLGFYLDPFGWDYQRFGIGWRLWPSYYSNRYWLNDPWHYRLPPAYGPYRWVRYHGDALLVNIYSGQVVDVVYNFFW